MLEEVLHIRSGFNDDAGVNAGVKNYLAEKGVIKKNFENSYGKPSRKQAEQSIAELKNIFGNPYYEDKWITVFKIR